MGQLHLYYDNVHSERACFAAHQTTLLVTSLYLNKPREGRGIPGMGETVTASGYQRS